MIEPTTFQGSRAVALRTRALEVVLPLEYGPRVMSLRSLARGGNLLHEFANGGPAGDEGLLLRGGHRLWHAPEDMVRTYQPDNDAPAFAQTKRGVTLTPATEARTGLQKQMGVELAGERTLKVSHKITNHGLFPVECAPWALTMFKPGGLGVVPLPPPGTHPASLLPAYSLVPWSYTNFALPVWQFHHRYIALDTSKATTSQKIGLTNYLGWSAYWFKGVTFVKFAKQIAGATYPDRGCPWESYCDANAIELETLAPLTSLAPGKSATHTEWWGILDGLRKPSTDKIWETEFVPAVNKWLKTAG